MASISNDNGRRRIQFIDMDGRRRAIHLGKVSHRFAETFKVKVEALAKSVGNKIPPDDEVSRWLDGLDVATLRKLTKAGLVEGHGSGRNLKEFLAELLATLHVKPGTMLVYKNTERNLLAHFGDTTPLRRIGPADADKFKHYLKNVKVDTATGNLADATVNRRLKIARGFFASAMKWRRIPSNPFAHLKIGSERNKARLRFIDHATSQKVLEQCPDAEWRLIFALSRYAGLRCPSEHLGLKWSDVLWDTNRFRVTSPKTEHHEGMAERWVPIFPDLRPYLMEAFENAEPGATWVITRYRKSNANLRTQLHRIIRRAGLTPWPRTFHNLRATCQTELVEKWAAYLVCAWLGNSERIAASHYLQITDEHFDRAAHCNAQQPSESVGNGRKPEEESMKNPEKFEDSDALDGRGRPRTPTQIYEKMGVKTKRGATSRARADEKQDRDSLPNELRMKVAAAVIKAAARVLERESARGSK